MSSRGDSMKVVFTKNNISQTIDGVIDVKDNGPSALYLILSGKLPGQTEALAFRPGVDFDSYTRS
jgi:hypothetical protein